MTTKKKFRVFIDDVKIRHTSHWDEDFMSREELEALHAKPKASAEEKPDEDDEAADDDDARKD